MNETTASIRVPVPLREALDRLPNLVCRLSFYVRFPEVGVDGRLIGISEELSADLGANDVGSDPVLAGAGGFDADVNGFLLYEGDVDALFGDVITAFDTAGPQLAADILPAAVRRCDGSARAVASTTFLVAATRDGDASIIELARF